MHVSLPRRSYRTGLSMQCLLWICFGLLAAVPWQIICGQDASDSSGVVRDSLERASETGDDAANPPPPAPPKRRKTLLSRIIPVGQASSSSLIFRSQSSPTDFGPNSVVPPSPADYSGNPDSSTPPGQTPTLAPNQVFGSGGQGGSGSFLTDDRFTGRSGEAYGAQFRASAITGPAIGREHPIFPIEMMPYAFLDNNLFFSDIRGFSDTKSKFGGNFGGGYRRYLPSFDRILGVNAYFDYDNLSGATFREVGFGVESLGALYDVRANAYLPTGPSSQQLGLANINGTQVFQGHILLVDQLKTLANALHGFDSEIGIPIPGRVAERHDVRVFGGGYWFEGSSIPSFGGWKTRIQANVIPSVTLNLQVSNDQQFKTNVVFGATWAFGGYRQPPEERKSQYSRMTTPVQRQYNMVVGITTQTLKGVTVTDPTTGNPYFFEHVDSSATGPSVGGVIGDGSIKNPFQSFVDAQNAISAAGTASSGDDIIFVHANSQYTGQQVNLQQNVRVLGESANVEHQVNTPAGLLNLPHVTFDALGNPAGVAPLFTDSPGSGVVLANNSEFSGFSITNSSGVGILGSGISNALVRQDTVTGSIGESVLLENTTGMIKFLGDTINDSTGNLTTFHINGTTQTGRIIFSSDPLSDTVNSQNQPIPTPGTINNTGGIALLVEQTQVGSLINFTGSTVNDTSGRGIVITNDAGGVAMGDANITNSLGIGISILGDTGIVTGNGAYAINGSAGDSILIQNIAAGGFVLFTNPGSASSTGTTPGIAITNRQSRGIYLNDNAGTVIFETPVSIAASATPIHPITLAAVEYQGSSGDVSFTSTSNPALTITNGNQGVLIGTIATDGSGNPIDNTGHFTVTGNTLITGTSGIGIEVLDDKSTVSFNGSSANTLTINQRGNIGIEVLRNKGSVSFNGITTINNNRTVAGVAAPVSLPGVDIRGNTNLAASVTFATLNVLGATGPSSDPTFGGVGVNIGGTGADVNPANVTIATLDITSATTNTTTTVNPQNYTALYVNNEGTLTGSGTTAVLTGLRILGTTLSTGTQSTVSATGGTAVDIENSIIKVDLNQVNSTNALAGTGTGIAANGNGITLVNNQSFTQLGASVLNDFMFEVLGQTGSPLRSGGTITGAAGSGVAISQSGATLQTGDVSLNQIALDQNLTNGVTATGLLQLSVTNSDISQNTHDGILATSIPRIDINTSNFNSNGTTRQDNAIHLTVDATLPGNGILLPGNTVTTNATKDSYVWNIVNNNTTTAGQSAGFIGAAGAGDLVVVDSGGATLKVQTSSNTQIVTPLAFNFTNNSEITQTGLSISNPVNSLAVNWSGPESGNINANTITLAGFDRAISMQNPDVTYLTSYFILGNTVTGNGGGNTGIFVNNLDPTDLTIASLLNSNGTSTANTFNFTTSPATVIANNDIGMQFSVLNSTTTSSNINLTDNIINMTGQNVDQGVVFKILQAPAFVTLSNNTISVNTAPNTALTGQGIDFQNILGTIHLQGALSNAVTINGSNTLPSVLVPSSTWVFLNGSRTGQFFVNGYTVQ